MDNKQKVNKREESTRLYMDALQDNNSKLCIVRVDLGYKKDDKGNVYISLDEANKDFKHMMDNKRGKPSIFKHQVGQMCLKEYTPNKGVHFHTVFVFNGNKVQKDAYMGDEIGKYWNEVTNDKGSHFNCNRQKYKYKGVGMLNHTDTEKREIFDKHVVSYLCKDDDKQDLSPVKNNKKDRAFTRGIMPKIKSNIGRPRG